MSHQQPGPFCVKFAGSAEAGGWFRPLTPECLSQKLRKEAAFGQIACLKDTLFERKERQWNPSFCMCVVRETKQITISIGLASTWRKLDGWIVFSIWQDRPENASFPIYQPRIFYQFSIFMSKKMTDCGKSLAVIDHWLNSEWQRFWVGSRIFSAGHLSTSSSHPLFLCKSGTSLCGKRAQTTGCQLILWWSVECYHCRSSQCTTFLLRSDLLPNPPPPSVTPQTCCLTSIALLSPPSPNNLSLLSTPPPHYDNTWANGCWCVLVLCCSFSSSATGV